MSLERALEGPILSVSVIKRGISKTDVLPRDLASIEYPKDYDRVMLSLVNLPAVVYEPPLDSVDLPTGTVRVIYNARKQTLSIWTPALFHPADNGAATVLIMTDEDGDPRWNTEPISWWQTEGLYRVVPLSPTERAVMYFYVLSEDDKKNAPNRTVVEVKTKLNTKPLKGPRAFAVVHQNAKNPTEVHQKLPSTKVCAACGTKSDSCKACGRCRSVAYCDRDCQRAHWKQHKDACKPIPDEDRDKFAIASRSLRTEPSDASCSK